MRPQLRSQVQFFSVSSNIAELDHTRLIHHYLNTDITSIVGLVFAVASLAWISVLCVTLPH